MAKTETLVLVSIKRKQEQNGKKKSEGLPKGIRVKD